MHGNRTDTRITKSITWSLGLLLCGRDFVHFSCFVNKAAFNYSEVQIASNISVHQDLHQFTWCKHTQFMETHLCKENAIHTTLRMNKTELSPLVRKNLGMRSTFHSFPRPIDLWGPRTLNFLYNCKCRNTLVNMCHTPFVMHFCPGVAVCVNTPPQGERLMHSLLHRMDFCQCEEPFSHSETLNQRGCIPERYREQSVSGQLQHLDSAGQQ